MRTWGIVPATFDKWFKSPSKSRTVNADDGLMQRAFIYNYRSLASTWAHLHMEPLPLSRSHCFSQQPILNAACVFPDWAPEVNSSYCHGFLWSSVKKALRRDGRLLMEGMMTYIKEWRKGQSQPVHHIWVQTETSQLHDGFPWIHGLISKCWQFLAKC